MLSARRTVYPLLCKPRCNKIYRLSQCNKWFSREHSMRVFSSSSVERNDHNITLSPQTQPVFSPALQHYFGHKNHILHSIDRTKLVLHTYRFYANDTSNLSASKMSSQSHQVEHDEKKRTFYILIDKDSPADISKLEYEYIDPNLVDLWHTFVPKKHRGLGLAKILAKEVLEHFSQKEGMKIRVSCTYLQKYVKENPSPSYASKLE